MRARKHRRTIRQAIPVKGIDPLLHEQLVRPTRGAVHSVYRKAMNIRTATGDLVTVLAGDLRGPNHLSIPPETAPLNHLCDVGDAVDAARSRFVLHTRRGEVFLEITPHSVLPPDSGKWDVRPDRFARNCVILESLAGDDRSCSAPRDGTVPAAVNRELSRRTQRLRRAVSAGTRDDVESSVLALIGTGGGTTPAGDDILLGLIAGLILIAGKGSALPDGGLSGGSLPDTIAILGEMIRRHRGRTTFISSMMLEYGTRGRAIGLFEDLVEALCTLPEEQFRKRLSDLCDHGASSGRCMVDGLSFACAIVCSSAEGTFGRGSVTGRDER